MTELQVFERRLTLSKTFQGSAASFKQRQAIVIHARSETGNAYGEACPMPDYAGEDYDTCLSALHAATQQRNALDRTIAIEQIIPDDCPCAQFALDTLRHDYAAQQEQVPVCQLINSNAAHAVWIQSTLDALSHEQSHCPRIKYKVGEHHVEEELQRIIDICAHLHQGSQLRLDANGAWSCEEALAICAALNDLPIDYIEDPCADLADNISVKQQGALPIAIDQAFNNSHTRAAVLASPAFDAYILKPMCLGSYHTITTTAQAISQRIIFSDFFNGSIARCASRHLAAAIDFRQGEWHGLSGDHLFNNDFHSMTTSADFAFDILDAPGLCIGSIDV